VLRDADRASRAVVTLLVDDLDERLSCALASSPSDALSAIRWSPKMRRNADPNERESGQ